MTDEEYREKRRKRFDQRYSLVEEYNRYYARDWLDECWNFNTEDKVAEDPKATVKLIDKADELILLLLDEINRNQAEHCKEVPVYAVHVPHTKDEYYYKYNDSLSTTNSIDYYLKQGRDWELKDSTYVLFTEDEIKDWGLEDCDKTIIHQ